MIRRATVEDAHHCATYGLKFIKAAEMPEATFEDCLGFCQAALQRDDVGAFISERGVILGMITPLYYRPDYLIAGELYWWDESHQGLKLLKAFSNWARECGAKRHNIGTLVGFTPPRVDKLLLRMGYTLKEQSYFKEFD